MKNRTYFAAANGYSGFKSYFDNIFRSEDFKRIFILKGGPGTGKSTLMKRVAKASLSEGTKFDKILCSSDPDSLDGVIVYTNKGNYAVIDGTSPHERDAVIPGAIDLILNLGEGFDISKLESRREEIISLNQQKKATYHEAYKYLKTAGSLKNLSDDLINACFDYEKAECIADAILSKFSLENQAPHIALRRAFCKHGYLTLNEFLCSEETVIVSGKYGEENKILELVLKKSKQNFNLISFDPLCTQKTDAIISGDIAVICGTDSTSELNAGSCLGASTSFEELDLLKSAHNSILATASNYFSKASLLHLKLEKIYSNAMDFSRSDELFEKIINDIF